MSPEANKRIRLANRLLAGDHISEARHYRFVRRVVNRECSRVNDGCDVAVASRSNGAR